METLVSNQSEQQHKGGSLAMLNKQNNDFYPQGTEIMCF